MMSDRPIENPRRHSAKVTLYNLTGKEVGCIVDGRMYAVPAGQPGGGRGTLVVPEHIAQQMLELLRGQVTLSSGGYGASDLAAVERMSEAEVKALCRQLMRGVMEPLEAFRARFAREAAEKAVSMQRPAQGQGSAAGGKTA